MMQSKPAPVFRNNISLGQLATIFTIVTTGLGMSYYAGQSVQKVLEEIHTEVTIRTLQVGNAHEQYLQLSDDVKGLRAILLSIPRAPNITKP